MQLSKFTDYSVRVLIYLATLKPEELTHITEVSDFYQISRNHLVKVIHKLGQLGYIKTLQGKKGGFKLNRAPDDINIGEVIRILEPMQLLDCSLDQCCISSVCRLKKYLFDAKNKFLQELDQYTLQDLIEDNTPLFQLFSAAPKEQIN